MSILNYTNYTNIDTNYTNINTNYTNINTKYTNYYNLDVVEFSFYFFFHTSFFYYFAIFQYITWITLKGY